MSAMIERTPQVGAHNFHGHLILERIGEGGFGEVFRAAEVGNPTRVVALKVAKPGGEEELRRGARAQATLRHPAIARVLATGLEAEPPYVVLEFMAGGNLRGYLERAGRLAPIDALRVVQRVLDALAHAHARGIAHGDLKPENVLISGPQGGSAPLPAGVNPAGPLPPATALRAEQARSFSASFTLESADRLERRVRLTDFGLRRRLAGAAQARPSTLTGLGGPRPPPRRSESGGDPPRCVATGPRPGTALRAEQGGNAVGTNSWLVASLDTQLGAAGTPIYAAPEALAGEEVDARADVYSAGVLLFELVTGRRPWGTDLPSDLDRSIPEEIDRIVRTALRTDPDRRYPSAAAMRDAIGALVSALAPPPPRPVALSWTGPADGSLWAARLGSRRQGRPATLGRGALAKARRSEGPTGVPAAVAWAILVAAILFGAAVIAQAPVRSRAIRWTPPPVVWKIPR